MEAFITGALLACIIVILAQILLLVKLAKTGDSKYWHLLIGSIIVRFISVVLAYNLILTTADNLGEAVECMFVGGLSLISNLVLWIIGLILKCHLKKYHDTSSQKFVYIGIVITILVHITMLIVVPTVKAKSVSNDMIIALNNKYGNNCCYDKRR